MRAIDWQLFLQDQRDSYGKVLFTATELANVSGREWASLDVTLQRLIKRGVLQRYADGRYGLPGAVSLDVLVRSLDSTAYMTGFYALHYHNLITQKPSEVTCFTKRRHNRSRVRHTPLGKIVFVCITGKAYAMPDAGRLASAEQALCDFVYLCRQRSVVPADLVTFRSLSRIKMKDLAAFLPRYPKTVQREITRLLI